MATTKCVTRAMQEQAARNCRKLGPVAGGGACAVARMRVCPAPDVAPTIEEGADGINLLGVYQICAAKPTELAPYPPSRPIPREAAAEAELARLRAKSLKQSSEVLKLRSRAAKARKIELSLGFWLGLGLVSLGGAVLYLRR